MASTASDLAEPKAKRRMLRASMMVPKPWVMAVRGTASIEGKYRALFARVASSNTTSLVRESRGDPGSLKPMWPLVLLHDRWLNTGRDRLGPQEFVVEVVRARPSSWRPFGETRYLPKAFELRVCKRN